MKKLLTIAIVLFFYSSFSQCNITNKTFKSGENVSYDVYYKLGFAWFNAAKANFKIAHVKANNKNAFHFISTGYTLPNYDWVYKVRDTYESIVDSSTLSPLWFSRNTHEGGTIINNNYKFNYSQQSIFCHIESNQKPMYKDTLPINSCTLDVLTAIYVCRNISFSSLKINDTVPLKMVLDNEIHSLYIRFLGKEQAQTKYGKSYNCLKFSILLVEGSIFSGGEDMFVWVTNDKAKVPIKVEAKILVGSIISYVDEMKGLRWPITSEIKINEQKH